MAEVDWSKRFRTAAWAVVRRRCPQCGFGKAFVGWFRIRPKCEVCGHVFHRHTGSTTGVMQIGSFIIILFAFVSYFISWFVLGLSMNAAVVAMAIASTIFGLWFHPYAKLIWEAADVLIDKLDEDQEQN